MNGTKTYKLSDGAKVKLTGPQRGILLALCDAEEYSTPTFAGVVLQSDGRKIRETATGCALVRKALAKRNRDGSFQATTEGYWLGDTLRIERRDQEAGR